MRLFDRDADGSDDDITLTPGSSSETGDFEIACDLARAADMISIQRTVTVWDAGDPFATPPRLPGFRDQIIAQSVPDPNDDYRPYLQFRYQLFGQQRRFTAPVVLGNSVYRLPDVGVGYRQDFCGVGNGRDGRCAIFYLQQRPSQAPALWCLRQTSTASWGNWQRLSDMPAVGAQVAVGRNADGKLELFAHAEDGNIWHCRENDAGAWGGWAPLPGASFRVGDALAVGTNRDGTLELFAHGRDNGVWHVRQQSPVGAWGSWSSLGGVVPSGGSIVVASNDDGRLEVFKNGTDGGIWHAWQRSPNRDWGGWNPLGGQWITGPLAVGRNHDKRLEVFAQGLDGAIWHTWQQWPGGPWTGWNSRGGVWVCLGLTARENSDGTLELFTHGMDKEYWHVRQQRPNGPWGAWQSLGSFAHQRRSFTPRYGYPANAGRLSDGRLHIFQKTFADNEPLAAREQTGNGWSNWHLLNQLEEPPPPPPSAPTLNALTRGDAWIDVSWNAVSGAGGYKVGYGTERGGPYAYPGFKDVGNATRARLSPLSNGTRYYVAVKAYNGSGESDYSNQQSAIPNGSASGIAQVELISAGTDPTTPRAHQTFNVRFALKNKGARATGPFTLRIDRDEGAQISFVNFESLEPGQEATGSIVPPWLDAGAHYWKFFIGEKYLNILGRIL